MNDKEVNQLANHIYKELRIHQPITMLGSNEFEFIREVYRAIKDWQLRIEDSPLSH